MLTLVIAAHIITLLIFVTTFSAEDFYTDHEVSGVVVSHGNLLLSVLLTVALTHISGYYDYTGEYRIWINLVVCSLGALVWSIGTIALIIHFIGDKPTVFYYHIVALLLLLLPWGREEQLFRVFMWVILTVVYVEIVYRFLRDSEVQTASRSVVFILLIHTAVALMLIQLVAPTLPTIPTPTTEVGIVDESFVKTGDNETE